MGILIQAAGLQVTYMDRDVLRIPALEVYDGERIGIVGNIGAGKSTLLRVLAGEMACPGGRVQTHGAVAYMPQDGRAQDAVDAQGMAWRGRLGVGQAPAVGVSGGEETRQRIADALASDAHCILADEPTCNMDKEGVNTLVRMLAAYRGALVVVSHDQDFLDAVVDKIWALADGEIEEFYGNYSDYEGQMAQRARQQAQEYAAYVKERDRLEAAYAQKKAMAQRAGKAPGAKTGRKNIPDKNGMTKAYGSREKTLHRAADNMLDRLEGLAEIEKPGQAARVQFVTKPELTLHNKYPIVGEGVCKAYGERVLLKNASFQIPLGAKVALTGRNGAGKTTLLRMILDREPGIAVSPKAEMGYLSQDAGDAMGPERLLDFVAQGSAQKEHVRRAMLAAVGFAQRDLAKAMGALSGGERMKAKLCRIFAGRHNVLLLDEPTNYMDLGSTVALEGFIREYPGTIVFVTHDGRLVERAADVVYEIDGGEVQRVR